MFPDSSLPVTWANISGNAMIQTIILYFYSFIPYFCSTYFPDVMAIIILILINKNKHNQHKYIIKASLVNTFRAGHETRMCQFIPHKGWIVHCNTCFYPANGYFPPLNQASSACASKFTKTAIFFRCTMKCQSDSFQNFTWADVKSSHLNPFS